MLPLDDKDMVLLIRNGLKPAPHPKRVIVVGAGMAGLTAAYELQRAGHEVVVLEAQSRVGGRVYTMREPFSDGLYAEVGAMRLPRTHHLTMAYIEKFNIKTAPFTMGNLQAYYFLGGKKVRKAAGDAFPDSLGFELAPNECGKTIEQLWAAAIMPIVRKIEQEGQAAWAEIIQMYDRLSLREFLEENKWSEGAIEMFGLLADQEALMNSSFLELLREEVGNYYTNMVEIEGGTDLLPRAFLPELIHRIRFGAKMIAIDQSPELVTIHYQTVAGRRAITGDYAIVTLPFPVLRHIEALKPFSRGKQRAIRQLHYDSSSKILFQCVGDSGKKTKASTVAAPSRTCPFVCCTIPITAAKLGAEFCSQVTPGRMMPNARDRFRRGIALSRRWKIWRKFIRKSSKSSKWAHRGCGTTTNLQAARLRCSIRDNKHWFTTTSSSPKAAFISPANMHRWHMRGSKVPSSRDYARRLRYTRRVWKRRD
ncbi:MAG: FAD-dependent oxidoreductase [Chloroflexi bacterium]|nr:FAD-dependent oxidoreductase [Chloroflexota bacterium]